jgi:hypothetical protein
LITALNGYAVMLKSEKRGVAYTLPFIDKDDLDEHGLRPCEPSDNFFPAVNAPDDDLIWFVANRMATFRKWMKLAPEMLSGTVNVAPAQPGVRLGTMTHLPIEGEFMYRVGGKSTYIWTKGIHAYVVGFEDRYQVNESDGSVSSSGSVSVIRGEPDDGSFVAPPIEQYWTTRKV